MKNLLIFFPGLMVSLVLMGCEQNTPPSPPTSQNLIHETNHSLVQIETNYGLIYVELFDDVTPQTVENFIQYVDEDFYDKTQVHQILPGFIVQAGAYDDEFQLKPVHGTIINEASETLKHTRGTIAMMRGNHPNSATSEFFINLKDNELFDIQNGYAVFGKVIQGIEILDQISHEETCSRGPFFDDVPCEPVVIEKIAQMS